MFQFLARYLLDIFTLLYVTCDDIENILGFTCVWRINFLRVIKLIKKGVTRYLYFLLILVHIISQLDLKQKKKVISNIGNDIIKCMRF